MTPLVAPANFSEKLFFGLFWLRGVTAYMTQTMRWRMLVRKKPCRVPKKMKMDEAGNSQAVAFPDENEDADVDPATSKSQPPPSSSSLEAEMVAVKRFVETDSASPNTTFSFPGHSRTPSRD